MANRTLLPKIFTAAALAFAAASAARATQFELVAEGKARAQLFVDGKASFAAAKELRKYVAAMTGVKLECVREEEELDPALGTVYFGRPQPDAKIDEYVIEVGEGGKTLDLTGDAGRGMFYATYRLLEHFGVRFWSGHFETVPKAVTLALPEDFRRRDAPVFAVRNGQGNSEVYCPGWNLKSGQTELNAEFGFKDYRVNCGEMLALHYLQPAKYFSAHPDWYAWRRGKAAKWKYPAPSPVKDAQDKTRCTAAKKIDAMDDQEAFFNDGEMVVEDLDNDGGECPCAKCRTKRTIGARASSQPCLSSPGARKQLLDEVLADLAKNPACTVGLGSNDTDELCQCVDCRKIVEQCGSPSALEGTVANWIVRKVRGKYPKVRVGILSYWLKNAPFNDNLKLEPEVWVCVCGAYNMSRPASADRGYAKRIERWRQIAPGRLTMWDYYANFRRFTCACPNIDLMAANLRWYRDLGFTQIGDQMILSSCGHLVDLRSYIHAKFMWNPDQDVEKLVDEWFDNVGGPAAGLLKRYYAEQKTCRDREGVSSGMYGSNFYDAVKGEELLRWYRYFEEAKALVAKDPQRMAVIERMGVGTLVDLFVFRNKVRAAAEAEGFDLPSQLDLCQRYEQLAKQYSDQWSEHKSFDIFAWLNAEEAEELRRSQQSVQEEIDSFAVDTQMFTID